MSRALSESAAEPLDHLLRRVDPAVVLVSPRILGRVIREELGLTGFWSRVPHRKSVVISRDRLWEIVEREELSLDPADELPDTVILLPRPQRDDPFSVTRPQLLRRYWRLLFHAAIHRALEERIASGRLSPDVVQARIREIGRVAFEEITSVLRHEALLPPDDSPTQVYVEFAAVCCELRSFAPHLLPMYFPSLRDPQCMERVLAQDVAADELLEAMRVPGSAKGILWTLCGGAALLSVWNIAGTWRAESQSSSLHASRQPVHAVLIVDNSRGMGVETLGGTLLDRAKSKALEFLEALPVESRVSVVPLCGSEEAFTLDGHRNKDDAHQALQRIQVVDLAGRANQALELAIQACRYVPELPAKRVVLLTDLQANGWAAESLAPLVKQLPELQIAPVAAETPGNLWIAGLEVQDAIADVETPTTFLATIRYRGPTALRNVQATLSINGTEVASRVIDVEPNQSRQVEFTYQFDVPVDPGRANFSLATLRVRTDGSGEDRLKGDNVATRAVPVVSSLPVVFVDQYGEDEDIDRNRVGETYRLRRLLAPRTSREQAPRQLIRVEHVTIDELTKELLSNARLVVIAGVEEPGDAVPLLREYVDKGGQLFLAAGGDFDPALWTDEAWLNGGGILPAPLNPEPFGTTPEEAAGELKPFFLSFDSMQHDYFLIEQESNEALRDLYQSPLFFKAVQAEVRGQGSEVRDQGSEVRGRRSGFRGRKESVDVRDDSSLTPDPRPLTPESPPRVLATYGNGLPFLVERTIGTGRVVLLTTGISSNWNTLAQTNAILLYDRIFRGLLQNTLPVRNFAAGERITLPIHRTEELRYVLQRPDGDRETLAVEALGTDEYGVTIRHAVQSGNYLVTAFRPNRDPMAANAAKVEEIPIAVHAAAEESELSYLTAEDLERRLGAKNYRLLEPDEPIHVEGGMLRGQSLWKTFAALVLICLAVEMAVLSAPNWKQEPMA